jgi:hypothetical protein
MAAEIIQIDPTSFESQIYAVQDTNLISSFDINTLLTSGSYIELFIYDNNQNILSSNYNFIQYTIQNNGSSAANGNEVFEIILDPENILVNEGLDVGIYITYFNFLNKKIGSNFENLYITEISSDRTELRLDSTLLSNLDITEKTLEFVQERETSTYFLDFYLNFGDNQLIIANNISLDNTDVDNPTILIKLYEPLPAEFDLNSTLWIVTSIEEPTVYQVTFEEPIIIISDTVNLNGPNFNLDVKDRVNNSTLNLSYSDLINTTLTSSQQQINSLLEEKELDINIDYTNFSDFTHFSSVKTRIENFYYKVGLIEQYSASIATLNNTISNNPSGSITIFQNKIDNIITNFDGYDYYLYYSSGSWAYPKINTEPPYQLYPTGSLTVLSWLGSDDVNNLNYGGILLSASIYDQNNKDNLHFVIPEYIREDSSNDPYLLFIDMVGQHYDNIWIYYKDVTQKYNADNRLESGVSKDIVADAIRDFGVKLYQNNFSNQDLYTAFLGLTPDGALFPFPEITGSLPTPTGFEYVDTLISASNDYLPLDDVNKSLYKRIYHNLPYLLKAKGTLPGLRALITSYGIPDTILRINEYGGKDKINSNDWDYWQNEFNYAFYRDETNYVTTEWVLNSNWNSPDNVPSTLTFRFKTDGLPQTNIPYSQSLWSTDGRSALTLTYTGSGYISSSYSGSIIDPYYQYATLTLYPDSVNYPNSTASVYLPFFDGGWWSTMVTRNNDEFELFASNKIYEGGDNGTLLGFFSKDKIQENPDAWTSSVSSQFGRENVFPPGGPYNHFSGSFQEIRYYNTILSESIFKDYVMNPYLIEGNSLNSGPNELAFRATLGGELYTGSISTHPKITGSWAITNSFTSDSNFYFPFTPTFLPNIEYFFYDQPIAGIKNTVSDKIRLENDSLPSGSVLSPLRALSQTTAASASYTANINYLEVAFSPQNEINEDIMSQLGFFNIGDYIGDPAFRFSPLQSYPNLDNLRNAYFEKYTKNYDLVDFIRLIKFFDNSLFKMIKDFVPARTSLASGVVIKQHLLERNRYPQPQVDSYSTIAYTTSGSTNNTPFIYQDISVSGTLKPQWNDYNPGTVENFSGGTGGSFEMFNGTFTSPSGSEGLGPNNIFGITQSWYETYQTISGSVTVLHNSQDEFYDGEFSGSVILVTTQNLNTPYPLENASFEYRQVYYYGTSSAESDTYENLFLANITSPGSGEILFFEDFLSTSIYGIAGIPTYLKVAKIDCNGNDNSLPLGQVTSLLINTYISLYASNVWIEYGVTILNEQPDYYLYKINSYKLSGQNIFYISNVYENQVLDYYTFASRSGTFSNFLPIVSTLTNYDAGEVGDILGYFETGSGVYTLGNTPNTPLQITASIPITASASTTGIVKMGIVSERNGVKTLLHDTSFDASLVPLTLTLTASFYPLEGDQIYVQKGSYGGAVTLAVTTASILITQSRAISSSTCYPVIIEPYITTPNYYNSDQNAIINNVDLERLSTVYQDVDYTPGILTPTNFDLIISGNATKAAVQDSNYSSKRNTIPRYEGSKSTSQKLNQWTLGDSGTYGKIPTINSTKAYVAYCDYIEGWPPEKMNSSAAHIIYLIKDDGTIVIPGVSENSLIINKGTFESGEKITISSKNIPTGEKLPYRTITRGGTRIEPILYTQSGSAPSVQWNTTMSFQDIVLTASGSVGNYLASYNKTTLQPIPGDNTPTTVIFNNTVNGIPVVSNGYQVPLNAVSDGVSITLTANVRVAAVNSLYSSNASTSTTLQFAKNGVAIPNSAQSFTTQPNTTDSSNPYVFIESISYTIPNAELFVGDTYTLIIQRDNPNVTTYNIQVAGTNFQINQQPIPTSPVTSSGYNSIWGYADVANYPNVITSSQSTLVNLYGDPNAKQTDIAGSGFNSIVLPWSIKYADEFRFEGREDFVYQVGKIFAPWYSGSDRITQTGSIEVHFNANLPVSASSSIFNLDHFLIRRYVDDPSLILFEGFKPIGSEGPFIIKPEFVNQELNKSIDEYITDLTQKGLL